MRLSDIFERCLAADYRAERGSANYAVERSENELCIFFEDSDGAEDWSVNLDFTAAPYDDTEQPVWFAHRGFLDAWKRTLPYLKEEIADQSVRKILLAGYSHGAAIALLCHEYVWRRRPELRENLFGYGFGCPRVVWGFPRASIKKRWENFLVVRNLDDAITHLPPAILGYSHVGSLLEIGGRGKYGNIEAHYADNILRELRLYDEASPLT